MIENLLLLILITQVLHLLQEGYQFYSNKFVHHNNRKVYEEEKEQWANHKSRLNKELEEYNSVIKRYEYIFQNSDLYVACIMGKDGAIPITGEEYAVLKTMISERYEKDKE